MKIKGYITNLGKYNEGVLLGEWITFPIDENELEEVFERIGINEEYEETFLRIGKAISSSTSANMRAFKM